tara:strand:+ start:2452 stop:3849 length:1398 start_codon:yes stop_codon:yes gene_type:complete
MSFVSVGSVGLNNQVGNTDVLTQKGFYDFDFKESCRFATDTGDDLSDAAGYTYNTAGTITKDANGVVTIDGGTIALNNRILVKNQTAGLQNGIYTVTTLGAADAALVLTRSDDCNSDSEVTSGMFVHVEEGSVNANKNFALTTSNTITLGTTALTFTNILSNAQTSGDVLDDLNTLGAPESDGQFIVATGAGAFAYESGDTVRTSLGLGTAAVAATGIANTNVPVFTSGVADNDFLRVDGTSIEGRSAAEVLSDLSLTSAEVATGVTQFTTTALASTAEAADGVLTYDHSAQTIKYHTFASVCFLKGTKITLPDYSQKNIEDLTLADDVLTYNIDGISNIKDKNVLKNVQLDSMNGKISQSGIRNIWINPTDSYLVINDKLKVTKNHIVHFKRDNQYYFRFADHLTIGDELMNDKEVYESVESIEEIHEKTNVYNFELDKDNTYFAENYLVHHYCELCSGYSKII